MVHLSVVPTVLLLAVIFLVVHHQWYADPGFVDDGVRRELSPSKFMQDFWNHRKIKADEAAGVLKKNSPIVKTRAEVVNKLSLVYVVGVEGSGYNEVTAVIATIAKTCKQHVLMKNPTLRASRMYKRASKFVEVLNSTRSTSYNRREIVLMDEQSFPAEGHLWNSTTAEKREHGKYNIDWVYQHTSQALNTTLKIIYVNRDLYQTAASITTQPSQFRSRVDVSREFASYIEQEYKLISANKANLWAQISYEDVVYARNCSAMVSGIVEFMQWSECDVEHACYVIQDTLKPQPIKDVDAENYAYIIQDNSTVFNANTLQLSIPLIDISDSKSYSFTTFVSDRKPFSFTPTPASKTISPKKRAAMVKVKPYEDRMVNFTSEPVNTLSYLYIVGVEGVGHHGVTPVLASIAKTCNYHVLYENAALRTAHKLNVPNRFKSTLSAMQRHKVPSTKKVIVIEDQSFPTDTIGRNTTLEHKKNITLYSLEWIYEHTKAVNVSARFIHLTRDFYRTVASHPEFDSGFERHADILYAFLMHINAEYEAVNRLESNLWTEVDYESFTHMHNCSALVSAIVNFMQWDECDVEFACEVIKTTVKVGRNRTINSEHYNYARTFNTTLSIPKLDMQPTNVYNFRTVVSERKMFSFIHNMTNRARGIYAHQYKFPLRSIGTSINRNASSLRHPFALVPHTTRASNNNVSFLYVVGVDGSGNADVSRTLTNIAQACQYHVLYKHKALWRAQTKQLPRTYVATLESIAHSLYQNTNKLLILEDAPFAAEDRSDSALLTSGEKRKQGKNNLVWVHDRLAGYQQATSRFLYVNRPLTDILSNTNAKVTNVELHAKLLQDYIWYIHEEYTRIVEKGGVWGQAEYDWFAHSVGGKNCTALVTALVEFTGWSECDIADACGKLSAMEFTQKSGLVNGGFSKKQNEILKGINATIPLPIIPYIAVTHSI